MSIVPTNIKSFLKKYLIIACISFSVTPALALSPLVSPSWKIYDGKLLDPNGKPFVFRGITIDHTLAPEKTLQSLKDIAALGANSAQIEFSIRYTANQVFPRPIVQEVKEIIQTCVNNKLVCVLEPNDVAGFGSIPGSSSPAATVEYWREFYQVLQGMENYIIIGLGNQHFDAHPQSAEIYSSGMISYIQSLHSVLPPNFIVMVDGNVWSQDTDKAMQKLARAVNDYEPTKLRTIYSVDFFDAYVNPELARDYITTFKEIGAPLVIGGFGSVPYYHPYNIGPITANAPRLPVESVMQYAEDYGTGYFAWSWSGNKNPALDLTENWNKDGLTQWGNLVINGANGIKATAKQATHFSSTPANQPPVANFEAYNYPSTFCNSPNPGKGRITAIAKGSSDPDGDTLTYSWSLSGGIGETASGYEVFFASESGKGYQLTLTVTDSKGASTSTTKSVARFYLDCFSSLSSSIKSSSVSSSSVKSSSVKSSSSTTTSKSSSSVRSSSGSSVKSSSRSSSSVAIRKASCIYEIKSQWHSGFTAVIRIKNLSDQNIDGWNVNWEYADGSKISNLWNANWNGSNPYAAKNLNWNSTVQPNQTIEFGFQGTKPSGSVKAPIVTGVICE